MSYKEIFNLTKTDCFDVLISPGITGFHHIIMKISVGTWFYSFLFYIKPFAGKSHKGKRLFSGVITFIKSILIGLVT